MHEGSQTLIQTPYQLQIRSHSLDSSIESIESIHSFGFILCYASYVTIFYSTVPLNKDTQLLQRYCKPHFDRTNSPTFGAMAFFSPQYFLIFSQL